MAGQARPRTVDVAGDVMRRDGVRGEVKEDLYARDGEKKSLAAGAEEDRQERDDPDERLIRRHVREGVRERCEVARDSFDDRSGEEIGRQVKRARTTSHD